jgi:two-component system response regulator
MGDKFILLVEDNPDEVELTELAFKKSQTPNKLVVTRDGVEALDYLFCQGKYADRDPNNKPAVILLDLKLPRLGGLEVLKAIQTDVRTLSIPVVVLTCSTEEKDKSESYRLGAKNFISKPTDFTRFAAAIEQVVADWLS